MDGELHAASKPSLVSCGSHETGRCAPVVRAYDFVVLGSGIAGLTYATKVRGEWKIKCKGFEQYDRSMRVGRVSCKSHPR